MALEYVVTKRVFGFDDTKTEKYVAKSVRSGQMSFSKTCAKVSRLCGVHRKVVDLVVSGLVDMMAERAFNWESSASFAPPLRPKVRIPQKVLRQAI
mgnify:CR=1 FL=1